MCFASFNIIINCKILDIKTLKFSSWVTQFNIWV